MQMGAFVDGNVNGIHHPPSNPVDLGPMVSKRRGFRTKEHVLYSGGLPVSGVEIYEAKYDSEDQVQRQKQLSILSSSSLLYHLRQRFLPRSWHEQNALQRPMIGLQTHLNVIRSQYCLVKTGCRPR